MKRPYKALLRGLLGLLLLGLIVALTDPARVLAQLRQAQPGWLLVGLLAAMASNIVSALRWRALARWLGAAVGVGMVYGLYGLAQGALGALALGLPRGAPR